LTGGAVKAIKTKYKGIKFRSRLEAKWAALFDVMNIDWQYEPQGYETSAGSYLPDFYIETDILRRDELLADGIDGIYIPEGIWVEIKGNKPTSEEMRKLIDVCKGTNRVGYIFAGWIGNCHSYKVDRDGQLHQYDRWDFYNHLFSIELLCSKYDNRASAWGDQLENISNMRFEHKRSYAR
jgi:hypothetical protein